MKTEIDDILTKWLMEDHTGEEVSVKEMYKVRLYIDDLQAQLAKHRWIPVSERLPDDMDEYLWYCDKPGKEILMFGDKELFHEGGYDFTHYKPITLPDKEKSDE